MKFILRIITFVFIIILYISATSEHAIAQAQINKTDPEMILISGGTFIMGQNSGEGDEKPEHKIIIDDFLLGAYEVTVSEFRTFCIATNRSMPEEPKWGWVDDHPIINTSWNDVMAYITWFNEEKQENYRLPTEAEFEYVIRNGGQAGIYPWGNENPQNENLADLAYREKTSNSRIWKNHNDGFAYTAPVGSYDPNKLGIYDINGNIWEWCYDWYQEYSSEKLINPKGPKHGTHKVGRGGSYNANPWHSRSASRSWVKPSFKGPGFRLAKDIKP